mmetsp:Transcript_8250/g.20785  ORF Transcript_8250/g.20785 Transcript_8250/m.20785 type:complete len:208 (+) Transcript_8250:703-1326(+)
MVDSTSVTWSSRRRPSRSFVTLPPPPRVDRWLHSFQMRVGRDVGNSRFNATILCGLCGSVASALNTQLYVPSPSFFSTWYRPPTSGKGDLAAHWRMATTSRRPKGNDAFFWSLVSAREIVSEKREAGKTQAGGRLCGAPTDPSQWARGDTGRTGLSRGSVCVGEWGERLYALRRGSLIKGTAAAAFLRLSVPLPGGVLSSCGAPVSR